MPSNVRNFFNYSKKKSLDEEMDSDNCTNVKNDTDNNGTIKVKLSLLDEDSVTSPQKEYMEEELAEFPDIKKNDIDVKCTYIYDNGTDYESKIYIRNGLSKPIRFEMVPFVVMNSKEEVLAYKLFDLSNMGEIPPSSARPFLLNFSKENMNSEVIELNDCKVLFDTSLKFKYNIDVEYENLPENISEFHKTRLINFLNSLPSLNDGEVTANPFELGYTEERDLAATIVFRNGALQDVQINSLPVVVIDADGDTIVECVFELDNLIISPCKARIHNFVFGKNSLLKETANLSNWKLNFEIKSN